MAKVAVVTGCSSGLGRAIALELASKNAEAYSVYATSRRVEPMEGLREKGIELAEMDVSRGESVVGAVKEILAAKGHIDVLLCNAGIAATAPLLEQRMDDVINIFQTNTFGVLRCVQEVAPKMIQQGGGKIVVVGSITASLASPFNGAYAASKAAVHSMCETLQMELAPFGISVMEVWAGTMKTDINSKVAADLDRYAQPSSNYFAIAEDIKERAAILEKSDTMAVERVAADVVKGITRKNAPRYISTGSDVRMYNILGYMQSWVCPGKISALFQEKFGLLKLQKSLQEKKKA